MRVVLACKKTAREFFAARYGAKWRRMLERFDLERVEVEAEHAAHHGAVDGLVAAFEAVGVSPLVHIGRAYAAAEVQGADLVISVGGDGELLNVARYLEGPHLVAGYRSYERSAGRLLLPPEVTPEALAAAAIAPEPDVQRWTRLQAIVHGPDPEPARGLALNEIFVGDRYSVGTARYTLHVGEHEERQRSSGLLVCTGAGSTGWYSNVLVPGPPGSPSRRPRPFDRLSRDLRWVVRDPIRSPDEPELVAGRIPDGLPFAVKSTMNSDGVISFDGSKSNYDDPRVLPFNRGATLEVCAADEPLRVLWVGGDLDRGACQCQSDPSAGARP